MQVLNILLLTAGSIQCQMGVCNAFDMSLAAKTSDDHAVASTAEESDAVSSTPLMCKAAKILAMGMAGVGILGGFFYHHNAGSAQNHPEWDKMTSIDSMITFQEDRRSNKERHFSR